MAAMNFLFDDLGDDGKGDTFGSRRLGRGHLVLFRLQG